MAPDSHGTGSFRGASFTGADFTGATFRDCDLRQVKITDSWLTGVRLSGEVGSLVVNDVDPGARPSLAEVLDARATRMTLVRGIVDGLTDDDLDRDCPRLPAPGYPEESYTVGRCLRVIMKEECEHRRYAVRDLAALEADSGAGTS